MAFPGKHPTPKRERAWSEMEGVEFRPRASSGPPFIDRASSEMQVDTPSQRTPTPTFIDLTADESPVGPRRAARQMQVSEAGTDTTIVGTPDLNTRVTLLEQGQRRHDDTLMAINGQISLMSTRMDDSEKARRKDEQRRKRQREEDKEQRGWERYEDNQENERRHSQIFGLLREGINLVSHHMGGGAQIPTENPYHVPPSNIAPSAAGASTGGGYRAYSTGTAPRPAFDNHRTPDGRRKRQRAARPRKAAAPIPPTSTGTANPLAPRVRFPLPPRIPPPPAAAWATRAGNPAARAYPPVATQTQYPPSPRPPSTPGSSIGNRSQPAAGPLNPRTPAPNGA